MRADSDTQEAAAVPDEQVDLAVEVFRMLADATRIRLLWALTDAELSVGDLADRLGRNPSSVSQHLAKLRMARLVKTRRDGTTVYYRVENSHVSRLVRDAIHNAEHASGSVPRHHDDDPRPVSGRASA